jgi:hypothetical protein
MGDIECEQCGYVDAKSKFIHLSEYVGDADLQCHSCGGIICGLEADWQARCLAAEAERDALRAELAAVKAALPKWRKGDLRFRLGYGAGDFVAAVNRQRTGVWSVHTMVICGRLFPSQESAMLAVTEALGLPPCEVCE